MKEKLDAVSSSFCLAKWYRTNLRLDQGSTYSCHHCKPHKIDAEQIKEDPSKLTNTDYIIEKRQRMLFDQRPEECNYCWAAEDNGDISDRITKSEIIYAKELEKGNRDPIKEAVENVSVIPSQLEISFENTCNLKCSYCGPKYSSKWEEEYKQHGPYPTSSSRVTVSDKILNREYNPYVDAFWEWWPEVKKGVETLRVTGGEPLLSKKTYKLMDKIIEEDVLLNFSINSNMCVDIDPLLDRIKKPSRCFDRFMLFTSLESNKEQGEYSRFGLDFDLFDYNVNKYLTDTNKNIFFMTTSNILSITSYYDFLLYLKKLRKNYGVERVWFEPTYLRHPAYLNVRLLPDDIKHDIKNQIDSVDFVSKDEKLKLGMLVNYMLGSLEEEQTLRSDFVKFINEYDKRRDTNFTKVYPNLAHLLEEWK